MSDRKLRGNLMVSGSSSDLTLVPSSGSDPDRDRRPAANHSRDDDERCLRSTILSFVLTVNSPIIDTGLGSKATNRCPHKLSLDFNLSGGVFKGSLASANVGAKSVNFAGAAMQESTTAAGYFFGANQSRRVTIKPAP